MSKEISHFVGRVLSELEHVPKTVLDLNPGLQTVDLAQRLPQSFVTAFIGSCSSLKLMAVAKERAGKANLDNVYFVDGGLTNLPFEDGTFDVVVFIGSLSECFSSIEVLSGMFNEMYRVLSVKGQAFLGLKLQEKEKQLTLANEWEEANSDAIVTWTKKMPFGHQMRIERKELNLEIAFKRIK